MKKSNFIVFFMKTQFFDLFSGIVWKNFCKLLKSDTTHPRTIHIKKNQVVILENFLVSHRVEYNMTFYIIFHHVICHIYHSTFHMKFIKLAHKKKMSTALFIPLINFK